MESISTGFCLANLSKWKSIEAHCRDREAFRRWQDVCFPQFRGLGRWPERKKTVHGCSHLCGPTKCALLPENGSPKRKLGACPTRKRKSQKGANSSIHQRARSTCTPLRWWSFKGKARICDRTAPNRKAGLKKTGSGTFRLGRNGLFSWLLTFLLLSFQGLH